MVVARKKSQHRIGREAKKPRQKKARKIPPLPAGAVQADPAKQVYGMGGPLAFYKDVDRLCVQCGMSFVFSASEQKYWYETLGFIVYSTAIRCVTCRRRKRSEVALQRQLAQAREFQQQNSSNPLAHLALAEALVLHRQRLGKGRMEDGIAASRTAGRLDPSLHESVYWEAACHDALGRRSKAVELYGRFLDRAMPVHRCRVLVRRAQRRLGMKTKK